MALDMGHLDMVSLIGIKALASSMWHGQMCNQVSNQKTKLFNTATLEESQSE
jgi:hypothetical protein